VDLSSTCVGDGSSSSDEDPGVYECDFDETGCQSPERTALGAHVTEENTSRDDSPRQKTGQTQSSDEEGDDRQHRRRVRAVESSSDEEDTHVRSTSPNPSASASQALQEVEGNLMSLRLDDSQKLGGPPAGDSGCIDTSAGVYAGVDDEQSAYAIEQDEGGWSCQEAEKDDEESSDIVRDGTQELQAGSHKTPKKVRVAYNHLVREAQLHEKEGHLARAVASYREALALCNDDAKLEKKIKKLETLRAVRRESKRQSVLIRHDDDGMCEAQPGTFAGVLLSL